MNDFFNSKIFRYGTLIADLMILSLLWAICSIPLITMGASTTALFYVTTRQISHREGYISRDFFRSFRQNFIKATLFEIILLIPTVLAVLNFVVLNYVSRPMQIVLVLQVVLCAELAGITVYLFPLLARFKLKFGQYFKNAFYFANRHISTTVTAIVFLGIFVRLFMRWPILTMIIPGTYAYFAAKLIMRVFRKYLPDMDKDEEEVYSVYEGSQPFVETPVIPDPPEHKNTSPEID
ncbi:MAG: DUF624 domain-containing protein [Clostridiales bacterium]|nr:DUF624 domain-containing protein [Clostridiales bacterium]